MNNTEQHIINRLTIDVNTCSEKAANALRDNLDVFLKEDIFPYLENYFKTLESTLPAQVIQIPKLTVAITASSDNNFEDIKGGIKKQIKQNIQKLLSVTETGSRKAKFLTAKQSKQDGFMFFLDKGIAPWWEGSKEHLFFSKKAIDAISSSKGFKNRFLIKIQDLNIQKRLVNQFSDTQIKIIICKVFTNDVINLLVLKSHFITDFKSLSPKNRALLWVSIIKYCLETNKELLVSKLEIIKSDETLVSEFVTAVLESVNSNADTDIPVNINCEVFQGQAISSNLEKDDPESSQDFQQKEIQMPSVKNEVSCDGEAAEKKSKNNESESTVEEFQDPEKHSTSEEEEKESGFNERDRINKSGFQQKEGQTNLKTKDLELDQKNQLKNVPNNRTENTIDLKTQSKINEEAKNQEGYSALKNPEQRAKDEILPVASIKESGRLSELKSDHFEKTGTINSDKTEVKPSVENIDNNETVALNETGLSEQQNKVKAKKEDFKTSGIIKEETITNSTRDSEPKNNKLLGTEDVKITSHRKNTGEYYVKNAGLIMLHPYLKLFFNNCELLDENDKIIRPELAIHLLHYLATKKEQQYESNMVFEKFLCGIPIGKSINREVEIPKSLKLNAETLLHDVVSHWEALNNGSAALLRNEFLQRSGKLSFKNGKPKIIVERKVYDFLLDKLPWTVSLCKLPWVDSLIFTDW